MEILTIPHSTLHYVFCPNSYLARHLFETNSTFLHRGLLQVSKTLNVSLKYILIPIFSSKFNSVHEKQKEFI